MISPAIDRSDAELPTEDARESYPRLALRSWPPAPNERAARYVTGSLLGRGGMGAVYSCEDRRVGRTVAMKVLERGADDASAIERFVDEARLQGRLEHPAIVPVYDLGTTDARTPFFTMKCVRGVTLANVLEAHRRGDGSATEWSPRKLLTAFVTVSLAVEYAHRCGVVHGDLKPENVMLGRFGEVHVLDWGCASRALSLVSERRGDATEGHSATTDVGVLLGLLERAHSGEIVGTPGYLAPEQARGLHGDCRSDAYALGAILFEIVAGQRLHGGPTALSRLVATLERPEQRPSVRAPELAIAPELDELVFSALAADPARRPSPRELATGIEHHLDSELARTNGLRAAEKHARAAAEHAERALRSGEENDREAALRDAGRALALDPGNVDACDVLTRLFRAPPATLPADARAMCDSAEHGLAASAIRAMSVRSWIWAAMIVPAIALGVRSWPFALLTIALIGLCVVTSSLKSRVRTCDARGRLPLVVLSMAAVACFGGLFGPLVLVPMFATTTATIFAIGFGRAERRWALAGALAAVVVPLLLEVIGVLPPSMMFVDGTIVLLPRMVDFSPGLSAAFFAVGSLMAIPMVVMLGSRLRDTVDERLRSLALVEWQLRRALPPALGERLGAALHDR